MNACIRPLLGLALVASSLSAYSAGVINILENGSDVVANASGSFNTTALGVGTASADAMVWGGFMLGSVANIGGSVRNVGSSTQMNAFAGITGPASFGTGGRIFATSATGDRIGVVANAQLQLPLGYASGSFLSGTATWANASLATLGLTPGTYVWNWGTGADADSLTLNVGVVPEPGSAMLLLAGLALAVPIVRARRRQA